MKTSRKILGTVIAASIAIGAIPLTELPIKATSGEGSETPMPKTIMAGVIEIEGAQKATYITGVISRILRKYRLKQVNRTELKILIGDIVNKQNKTVRAATIR